MDWGSVDNVFTKLGNYDVIVVKHFRGEVERFMCFCTQLGQSHSLDLDILKYYSDTVAVELVIINLTKKHFKY